MATRKRRIILSLSPELDKAIDRLAKAQERPRASVVVEILEQVAPQLDAFAEAIEVAKSAPNQAFQDLYGILFNALSEGATLGQSALSVLGKDAQKENAND